MMCLRLQFHLLDSSLFLFHSWILRKISRIIRVLNIFFEILSIKLSISTKGLSICFHNAIFTSSASWFYFFPLLRRLNIFIKHKMSIVMEFLYPLYFLAFFSIAITISIVSIVLALQLKILILIFISTFNIFFCLPFVSILTLWDHWLSQLKIFITGIIWVFLLFRNLPALQR